MTKKDSAEDTLGRIIVRVARYLETQNSPEAEILLTDLRFWCRRNGELV